MYMELRPDITTRRIASDVETVKKEAQHVLLINSGKVEHVYNDTGALSIIAVIGPTNSEKYGSIEEALLCEIGFGRARPYRVAEIPKLLDGRGGKNSIKGRKNAFAFTDEQYLLVAPKIFELMQVIANGKISTWKCNHENPFIIPTNGSRWSKTKKGYSQMSIAYKAESGIRFSVSRNDTKLVYDIFWAELFGNDVLAKQLKGLAAVIGLPLAHYRKIKTKKPLSKLPKYAAMKGQLERGNLPHYLKIHMLRHFLRKSELRYFKSDLEEMFGWDGRESTHEMRAGMAYPDPQSRLRNIRLRFTNDHANQNIWVFEVFYSPMLEKRKVEAENDYPF